MKILQYYKNLQLTISESLLHKMEILGKKYYPNEFGGFLIGKYSDNLQSLEICDFIAVEDFISTPIEFIRQSHLTNDFFKKLYSEHKTYYVGEWHTHPNGPAFYSQTDFQAMIDIAKHKDVQIQNPILLILSITKEHLLDFNFFILDDNKLEIYE